MTTPRRSCVSPRADSCAWWPSARLRASCGRWPGRGPRRSCGDPHRAGVARPGAPWRGGCRLGVCAGCPSCSGAPGAGPSCGGAQPCASRRGARGAGHASAQRTPHAQGRGLPRVLFLDGPVVARRPVGPSAHEPPTSQPSASRATGTVCRGPAPGRDQRTALLPIGASTREAASRWTPLPSSWSGQEGQRRRPCPRGHPGVSPDPIRRTNAWDVWSRRASPSGPTWRGRAASSATAARTPCSSASGAKRETAIGLRCPAVLRGSRATGERQRPTPRTRPRARSGVGGAARWSVHVWRAVHWRGWSLLRSSVVWAHKRHGRKPALA